MRDAIQSGVQVAAVSKRRDCGDVGVGVHNRDSNFSGVVAARRARQRNGRYLRPEAFTECLAELLNGCRSKERNVFADRIMDYKYEYLQSG